jgi:hypothetical protein
MATRADNRGLLRAYGKRSEPRWEYTTVSRERELTSSEVAIP